MNEESWEENTPSEGGLIWNPAYVGTEGSEMQGQVGDYLVGICLENKRVESKQERGGWENHIKIGSVANYRAEATLKGVKLPDDLFLFICGESRARLGQTTKIGNKYCFRLEQLKDVGKENPYAIYSRRIDNAYKLPSGAGEVEPF